MNSDKNQVNKRSRESPPSDEKRTKNIKMAFNQQNPSTAVIEDAKDQHKALVAAFTDCMKAYDLEGKINAAVKKSFTEELDQRFLDMATKSDITSLQTKLDDQIIENNLLREKMLKYECRLENYDKRNRNKNLIFSNVSIRQNAINSLYHVISENLKINSGDILLKDAFILKRYGENKATILAEFGEKRMIGIVFQHIKNLAGSKIAVERDLSEGEQESKRTLVQLKKKLLEIRNDIKIFVSQNTIKIGANPFIFANGTLEAKDAALNPDSFFSENYKMNLVNIIKLIN